MSARIKGLLERIRDGETVLVAEGYLFELERRGYLKAGAFVPEVVLDHPEMVRSLHHEFVHAGSDVVEAFTYYGHREKLRVIGREDDLEKLNRQGLKIAREVADETGTLMAGNICNTTIYDPSEERKEIVRAMFQEQITWAAEEGADFIIAETLGSLGEALLALECIKAHGPGLPAVITMSPTAANKTHDGVSHPEALKTLEEAGADVVGFNCHRGPPTILPKMQEIIGVCKGPLACVPVPYRTHSGALGMANLKDPDTGAPSFPLELEPWLCTRSQIADFGRQVRALGVQYVGLCCGNRPFYMRSLAEAFGRTPPASRYSPDMAQHYSNLVGKDPLYQFSAKAFTHNTKGE